MREASKPTISPSLVILARLWEEGVWETDVYLNGEHVGGGTSSHALSVAGDILYGSTNDHLNGSRGLLIDRGLEDE